jgi:hypothetical protein
MNILFCKSVKKGKEKSRKFNLCLKLVASVFQKIPKFPKISKIYKKFQKFPKFPKISKISTIFQKFPKFPKNSKPVKLLQMAKLFIL